MFSAAIKYVSISSAEMAKQRLSPPTQVQSLSEETSSSADDGRTSSKILSEEEDDIEEDDVAGGKGGDCTEVISRRKILAANGIGVVVNNGGSSTDNLISSPSATTSVSRDSPSTSTSDAGMYTCNSLSFRNWHSNLRQSGASGCEKGFVKCFLRVP